jgi:Fe-S-cluster containining protein
MKINDQVSLKERVLTWDDAFNFRCHPGIDCFNSCCRDVTIFLNPLDVAGLRKLLGVTSTEFLEQYTVRLVSERTGIPAVVLKMRDDATKSCPFVQQEGCQVYEARPYSCRLYPLDTEEGVEYRFIVDPETCHGLRESQEWTVERWRQDQGLYDYDDIDHDLKDVMSAEVLWESPIRNPQMQDMIYVALYDPDRFREFIFNTSFLKKFKVDEDILERIRTDDLALLYFAGQWLRFSLFGKKGFLKLDKEYLERKKQEVLKGAGSKG